MKWSTPRLSWDFVTETFILLALIVGPLNFASTRLGGMGVLSALGFAAVLAWITSLTKSRRRPSIPAPMVWAGGLVIIVGAFWSSGIFVPTTCESFTVHHWARVVARWPFSIVWRTGPQEVAFMTSLVLAGWAMVDRLRQAPRFLDILAKGVALTGVVVAILAFAQNISHSPGIYWQPWEGLGTAFCGPFYHHTSAGAFLNLVWPLGLALAWRAWTKGARKKALFWSVAACLIGAAHITHISRMPQVLAGVGFLIMIILLPRVLGKKRFKAAFAGFFLAGVAVVALCLSAGSRTQEISHRWKGVEQSFQESSSVVSGAIIPLEKAPMRADLFVDSPHPGFWGVRAVGWQTALKAISVRPLMGHGPANWMSAASHATQDPFVRTFFQFLQFVHNDFLQFWVEWGLIAGSAFIFILVATLFKGKWRNISMLALAFKVSLALVLVQSLWDFPLQMPSLLLYATFFAAVGWANVKGSKRA